MSPIDLMNRADQITVKVLIPTLDEIKHRFYEVSYVLGEEINLAKPTVSLVQLPVGEVRINGSLPREIAALGSVTDQIIATAMASLTRRNSGTWELVHKMLDAVNHVLHTTLGIPVPKREQMLRLLIEGKMVALSHESIDWSETRKYLGERKRAGNPVECILNISKVPTQVVYSVGGMTIPRIESDPSVTGSPTVSHWGTTRTFSLAIGIGVVAYTQMITYGTDFRFNTGIEIGKGSISEGDQHREADTEGAPKNESWCDIRQIPDNLVGIGVCSRVGIDDDLEVNTAYVIPGFSGALGLAAHRNMLASSLGIKRSELDGSKIFDVIESKILEREEQILNSMDLPRISRKTLHGDAKGEKAVSKIVPIIEAVGPLRPVYSLVLQVLAVMHTRSGCVVDPSYRTRMFSMRQLIEYAYKMESRSVVSHPLMLTGWPINIGDHGAKNEEVMDVF